MSFIAKSNQSNSDSFLLFVYNFHGLFELGGFCGR
jgi:hypothetical protein